MQLASLYNDCFSQKQADAQSGGSAKRYRSDCSWLCFHCLPASLNKGHRASPLVNANSVWTNEAQRSEAEWVNTLFATFLEDGAFRTKRPIESGSGTKYGWSERQKTRPYWNRRTDIWSVCLKLSGICVRTSNFPDFFSTKIVNTKVNKILYYIELHNTK